MKKYTLGCAALCAVLVLTGCKSKESAYKQAYLKAKQQDEMQQQAAQQASQQQEVVSVVPMENRSTSQAQVVDNGDNIAVRQESVTVVKGSGLKNFSVVVGSFVSQGNAEGLQDILRNQGYDAQVVVNSSVTPPTYRVVATTFNTKAEAESSRNSLTSKYPGAWLLYAK